MGGEWASRGQVAGAMQFVFFACPLGVDSERASPLLQVAPCCFQRFSKKLYAQVRPSPHPASGAAMPLCVVQCYRRGGAQAMVVRLPLFVTPSQRSFAAAFAITL